jgi:branched-chain amino acid transport system substrate-binding protein
MKKARLLAAALVLLAPLGAACKGGSGDTITIGVAGPINKPNGRSLRMAAEMAAEEINKANLIPGKTIRLAVEDDNGDASQAIEVAARLRANPAVLAVIGHVNTGATLAAAPIYNETFGGSDSNAGNGSGDSAQGKARADSLRGTSPLVEISPASSGMELTQAGDWTFRSVPTDREHGPVLARQVIRLGRSRAAILFSNDDYGRGVMTSFADAFQHERGTIVESDPYLPSAVDGTDGLAPYLTRAMRSGADALVIAGAADKATVIIGAARRLGFTGPILGGDGLTSLKDSAVADGLYVSSAWLPDRADAGSQDFVRRYYERYHELPDHRGANAYDLMYLLADAIKNAGASREAIRDYLAQVGRSRPAFNGTATGKIAFDENGDVVGRDVMIGVVRDRKLVTAK